MGGRSVGVGLRNATAPLIDPIPYTSKSPFSFPKGQRAGMSRVVQVQGAVITCVSGKQVRMERSTSSKETSEPSSPCREEGRRVEYQNVWLVSLSVRCR